MQTHKNSPSVLNKSLNWIANYTYRRIPTLINSYQRTSTSPKKLSFEDYILTPSLAREAGLMYVRQLRRDYLKQKQDIQKVISQYKSNTDLLNEKPDELLCPICLQLFSGPVTTSCNHTFCRMCIDESILFNPNCPSCRKNIRAEELIVSKATQAIIRMLLYKLDTEEVQKFVKKQLQYQDWLQRRAPKRSQLHKGQIIDVRDTEHIWCKGSIIEILPQNVTDPQKYEYLLVHYEGWASRFDEVISLQSLRLASCGFYMSRYEIPHYNLNPNNPQHYRCPVVTGPPRPVFPVIPQPEVQQIDSNSDSQLSLISQVPQQQQQQSINSGVQSLFLPQQQSQSSQQSQQDVHSHMQMNLSVNDRNPTVGQSSQSYGINNNNQDNFQQQQQQQQVFDNIYQQLQRIYAISQPPAYNDANNMLLYQQQQYHHNQYQRQQQQRRLHHNHSLLQVRQLQLLTQSDFGERVYLYLKPQQQQEQQQGMIMMPTNSEVDQQIIDMVNLQQQRQLQRQQQQQLYQNLLNNNMMILPNPLTSSFQSHSHSDSLILINHHNSDSNIRDNPQFKLQKQKDNQLQLQLQPQLQKSD